MEAIKKKMNMLKDKLRQAEDEAQEAEDEFNAKQREADEAEELVIERTKEMNDLEDELEKEEDNYVNLKARYDEATKIQDENERAETELSNRGKVDTAKLDRLERELMELQDKINTIEQDYNDGILRVEEAEQELDREEERFTDSDSRVKELEVEAVQTGNLLRSMEINEVNASKSQSKSSCKVDEMKDKVDEKCNCAEEKEEESAELELRLQGLDQDVQDARDRYHQVKSDYDALLAEVAEI